MSEKKLGKFVLLARKTGAGNTLDGALHFTDCDTCKAYSWCHEHPDMPAPKPKKSMLSQVSDIIEEFYIEPMKKEMPSILAQQAEIESAAAQWLKDKKKTDKEKTGVDSIIGAKDDVDEPSCGLYHLSKAKAEAEAVSVHPKYKVIWNPSKMIWETVIKWTKIENQMAYDAETSSGDHVIVGAEKFASGPPV